jgi:hypothetical protein
LRYKSRTIHPAVRPLKLTKQQVYFLCKQAAVKVGLV